MVLYSTKDEPYSDCINAKLYWGEVLLLRRSHTLPTKSGLTIVFQLFTCCCACYITSFSQRRYRDNLSGCLLVMIIRRWGLAAYVLTQQLSGLDVTQPRYFPTLNFTLAFLAATRTETTTTMSAQTPTAEKPLPDFDIVSSYRSILASDAELTMPVAAIEALVEAIANSSVSTVAETLALLEHHTAVLKASIPNPISLSAGTDLFQRYLITTLNRPASLNLGPSDDFRAIRNHLLSNGRLFVDRAKQSREKIASFGKHFIRDGATVLTNGGSRVVGALLRRAAESSTMRFRVVYVLSGSKSSDSKEGHHTVADLRAHNVPVATISDSAVAYSLGKVDMVIVGAEGVVENGGIISRLGTYQMGLLAKSKGKPFYVVAESHKFVRLYPLSQFDLPIEQKVLDFKVADDIKANPAEAKTTEDEGIADMNANAKCSGLNADDAVDFTVRQRTSVKAIFVDTH